MKTDFNWPQIAAFRLARHGLSDRRHGGKGLRTELVAVCRNVCGIQAQLMASAQMALRARMHNLHRSDIESALCQRRTLVRTSCMRQTLHLIPAVDFSIYINALKHSRLAALRRMMSKYAGVTQNETEALNEAVANALHDGPLTQPELIGRLAPQAGKNLKRWMELAWSIQTLRPALVEGLICYGPEQNNKATFVLVDQWLTQRKSVSEPVAQQILMRRYLSAYGPATLRDFSKWSGMALSEVKGIHGRIRDELVEVHFEGRKGFILRADHDRLRNCPRDDQTLRLLPGFDPFLLGHAEKDHLVDPRQYKRVYRNQGWISPVVLCQGRVIGVWSHQLRGKHLSLRIEPFEKLSRENNAKIEEEAASLAGFWESSWDIKVAMP